MIKVLGFALYGPLAASNRYRLTQYVTGLASMGIDLRISHLLGDSYLRARFESKMLPMASMIKAGLARFKDLSDQNDYDIVMLQCELFPLMPGWFERTLIRKPYLYDFDDAFYLKYRKGRMRFASSILGEKFDTVMAGAAAVTAGNHVLANYAGRFNSNTSFLPTVVDTKRYLPHTESRGGEIFTVGWIGSPSTADYLNGVIEPLATLGKEGRVMLVVIGGKAPKIPNVSIVELDWNEHTEIDLINSFDVGIMPLPDDEWARGKCAFKLIQYMACAVPVIASPVGANIDVINDGECGVLASTPQEWSDALRLVRDQMTTRVKMGEAGRSRVELHYSLDRNLPILANLIANTAKLLN
jgi:glycosyltransferase involved in cell wall biosynthesis